ncbi:unnamed protein product [Timema podura]|uniref:Uncharacterized protein n=1 Tax=Timema podura TaxID=61482 RepID=A0ABN7PAS6_TIMPD|nr:unnamed protein product [Timema podura]
MGCLAASTGSLAAATASFFAAQSSVLQQLVEAECSCPRVSVSFSQVFWSSSDSPGAETVASSSLRPTLPCGPLEFLVPLLLVSCHLQKGLVTLLPALLPRGGLFLKLAYLLGHLGYKAEVIGTYSIFRITNLIHLSLKATKHLVATAEGVLELVVLVRVERDLTTEVDLGGLQVLAAILVVLQLLDRKETAGNIKLQHLLSSNESLLIGCHLHLRLRQFGVCQLRLQLHLPGDLLHLLCTPTMTNNGNNNINMNCVITAIL